MTIPDVVDDMPTFEYYPLADGEWLDSDMQDVLDGAIQHRVLPYVRWRYDCPSCALAAILVRRYLPGERRTHGLHFDSQAYVTAVLGLSDPEDYEGGLYLQPGPRAQSRFYPRLAQGDLLVHSFDLAHGVYVHSGVRYSLILWFRDSPAAIAERTTPWMDRLAERGDPHALHFVARDFEFGSGGKACNPSRALQLYERSAEGGHVWSQTYLGCLHQDEDSPINLPANPEESTKWLRMAAESGFAAAQRILALTCLDFDSAEAVCWMRRAAEQLDVEAAHMLGELLSFGSEDGGIVPDWEEAKLWLRRSAGVGFGPSQQLLEMHMRGEVELVGHPME